MSDSRPSRRPSLRTIVLVLILLAVVGVVAERMHVSEEERILAAVEALVVGVETENRSAVEAAVLPTFDYSGPDPIRAGDRDAFFDRLPEFWGVADAIDWVDGPAEIRIAGGSAAVTAEGMVRFSWSESLVVHRAKIEFTVLRGGPNQDAEAWAVSRVDVLELRRGVF